VRRMEPARRGDWSKGRARFCRHEGAIRSMARKGKLELSLFVIYRTDASGLRTDPSGLKLSIITLATRSITTAITVAIMTG